MSVSERQWIEAHRRAKVQVSCSNRECENAAEWYLAGHESRAPEYASKVCRDHAKLNLLGLRTATGEPWQLIPTYVYLGRRAAMRKGGTDG